MIDPYVLNYIIRLTSYEFHLKESKLVIDSLQFVDYRFDSLVFLDEIKIYRVIPQRCYRDLPRE